MSHWRLVAAWADSPMRIMKTGISGMVTAMVATETRSTGHTKASSSTGTSAACASAGR